MVQAQDTQDHPAHKALVQLDILQDHQDTHKALVFHCRFSR
ncbi:hypothetical protein SAMN05421777_11234 [Fluoribacter gormanii]|uniref:Uncharacterized protein n=1 Tax=Fluoribacter gormanii TaxID=464 RepID=A0A377GKF3_9GAMM|nr:hypothetical protein SAMN05421777_11234 [Fluoribacter gormanii]STO25238.1 Uncharacterised protein [Fluoribacter gormanii]